MNSRPPNDPLIDAINSVVANDNCSGCGVCALISTRITVNMVEEGYLRPSVAEQHSREGIDRSEAELFAKVCPGANLCAPHQGERSRHPIFGAYVEAYQGWASDPTFRNAGASGGALSALSNWLVSSGRAQAVAGSGMDRSRPTRTVSLRITTREEALASAGSRYAPVANTVRSDDCQAFIGKPCEVSGRFQLSSHSDNSPPPLLLSFFCAGTPSQAATEQLTKSLGMDSHEVISLRYRGNGWPGKFEVRSSRGRVEQISYEESWGKVLGRQLQTRCKLCPDGTGEHADVAVGDFWAVDHKGFPQFAEGAGNSVIIARTRRGAALLAAAAQEGVLDLQPVDLDDVAAVQPLQTQRRLTLAGRLLGRRAAGYKVPRYRGYGLAISSLSHLALNFRAAAGTFARSRGLRR